MTDLVITYVNSQDENWQHLYASYAGKTNMATCRFRDWGFLPYIVRNTEKMLPWIRHIYIVVQSETQIPYGVNSDKVRYVFHEEIIPNDHLPTFNSTTIEMYLHKIPGISEEFIYGNDDTIPLQPLVHNDFYKDGLPRLNYTINNAPKSCDVFTRHLINSENTIRKALGMKENKWTYYDFYHSWNPMLKSTWEKIHNLCGNEIDSTVTKFRSRNNNTQYLSSIFQVLTGASSYSRRKTKYFDLNQPLSKLQLDNIQILCLNDNERIADYKLRKEQVLTMLKNVYLFRNQWI